MTPRLALRPSDHAIGQPLASFVEHAGRAPYAPALVWRDERISYGELRAMAGGAADRLDELGVPAAGRVAVLSKKTPEAIALVLACLLTGRPVLLPAPDLRPGVLRELLGHAGTRRVLSTDPLDGAVPLEPDGAAAPAAAASDVVTEAPLMLTTSGSTGLPKVVPVCHDAIERFADWASGQFDIRTGTNVLSYCGLNFDLSLLELWTTLAHGGCAVLVDHERATHGDYLLDLIDANRVNVVQGVPLLYRLLLDAAASRRRTLSSVKHAILTGDATPLSVLERLPRVLENARLYNVYGCTETNDSFLYEIEVERALELGRVPLGKPLPGVSAAIARDGRAVDGASSGELWVSTPFQTSGYLGPRSHDDCFVAGPEGTYFRTGDLVSRDSSGETFLEGRDDLQVKVRGVRVNLQEVEQTLLGHPDVTEAAVVAVDDELVGKRPHAVVRRRRGAGVNSLRLRTHCARRLTPAAIPSTIEVQDEPLPRTTTGKVDRGAVKCHAGAGAGANG